MVEPPGTKKRGKNPCAGIKTNQTKDNFQFC